MMELGGQAFVSCVRRVGMLTLFGLFVQYPHISRVMRGVWKGCKGGGGGRRVRAVRCAKFMKWKKILWVEICLGRRWRDKKTRDKYRLFISIPRPKPARISHFFTHPNSAVVFFPRLFSIPSLFVLIWPTTFTANG